MHPYITEKLAAERRRDMLSVARSYHLARSGRRSRDWDVACRLRYVVQRFGRFGRFGRLAGSARPAQLPGSPRRPEIALDCSTAGHLCPGGTVASVKP